jgi:DNA mismatch repair protein MutS
MQTFDGLSRLLSAALNSSNLPHDLSSGGYISDGFNAQLDSYRHMSTDCKFWINDFEHREQSQTGIKNLKIKYNSNFGYFIEITKANLRLVPAHYTRRQTTVNAERYITDELRQKEIEIANAQSLSLELEEQIFMDLTAEALDNSAAMIDVAEMLAELDIFCGWGEVAREEDYCCPEILLDDGLEIIDGRHPVVEQMMKLRGAKNPSQSERFTANDLLLKNSETQIALITGPNMAGKSTYIRQTALILIMAHIGCWVPARSCKFSRVDKIFSRIGSGDDLSHGRSTFMMEMSETANIMNNMTNQSLVILDEVRRSSQNWSFLIQIMISW